MKFPLLLSTISAIALLSSCTPEGYPNREDLVGTWIERSPYSDTLEFRVNGTLIRTSDGQVDTLIFRTDGERSEVSFLDPSDVSFGEETYDVLMLNGEKTMLLVDYRTTNNQNADGKFDKQ